MNCTRLAVRNFVLKSRSAHSQTISSRCQVQFHRTQLLVACQRTSLVQFRVDSNRNFSTTRSLHGDEVTKTLLALPELQSQPLDLSSIGEQLVEPTFQSLGLAHGWPSGWMQGIMEMMHIQLDMPWWATIITTTFAIRMLLFPVVVYAQKNMVRLNNNTPEMQELQIEVMKARGDQEKQMAASMKLHAFMKEKNVKIFGSYLPIMGQAFVFTSMFFALRGMAQCPVESMKTQGLYWFVDLTASDPIYTLPLITATSVFIHIYIGADGVNTNAMPPFMRKLLLALPVISFPVMCQFPAALNLYWFTTNVISIIQARAIRLPSMRRKLGIGEMIMWKHEDLPMNKLGGMGAMMANMPKNSPSTPTNDLKELKKEVEEEIDLEKKLKKK